MDLRYGINPGQRARVLSVDGGPPPFRVLNGAASYINVLDALNAYELARSLHETLGVAAAVSMKHVSPAGAALAGSVDEVMCETWGVDRSLDGSLASAYVRARDADPRSSYGDFVAVSSAVTRALADVLTSTANDGIIAPGYEESTVGVLARKKDGRMLVLEAEPRPRSIGWERRDVFGVSVFQEIRHLQVGRSTPGLGELPPGAYRDVVLGMLTVAFTQSNSVGFVRDGMMIGVGAGQQSRIDCTRVAGAKADVWWLRRHPKARAIEFREGVGRQQRVSTVVRLLEGGLSPAEQAMMDQSCASPPLPSEWDLDAWRGRLRDVAFVSDGMVPFRDNVDVAVRYGVRYFVEPGGSIRAGEVAQACHEYGVTHVETGVRLFHH